MFDCPSAAFESNSPTALFCDLEVLAADLLRLLPGDNGPLYFFGLSGGSIFASVVGSFMAQAGRTVRLILANPICQWWPQVRPFDDKLQKQYNALSAQAEADPVLMERLYRQGEILLHLTRAMQLGLKLKIFVSDRNPHDRREAKRLSILTGAEMIPIPTEDHFILPWLYKPLNPRADNYARLLERYQKERPNAPPEKVQAAALEDSQSMRKFWEQYPDIQAIADAM